jgi:Zn-dependent protease with chaperone function
MVIVSYVLVILLSAACVYLPYLVLSASESPQMQPVDLFLGGILIAGAIIAGAMLWSLLPRRDRFEAPGPSLDRTSHPRLFEEFDGIAAALKEPLPREVYLIGPVNAYVADRGGIMGFGSRRVIGNRSAFAFRFDSFRISAVLAHEFAHYYGGDTGLAPWVYKTQSAMIRTFQNIGKLAALGVLPLFQMIYLVVAYTLKWYFILFLRVINFV